MLILDLGLLWSLKKINDTLISHPRLQPIKREIQEFAKWK